MSELGPRARALIEATRSADDPTPAEAERVRGTLEARIALGAGTVMASAAIVTTTGNAAAAPTMAAVATAAWVKVAAGVVVACAVATGAGVVAMSSSNGTGATHAASPGSPSARIAVAPARPSMARLAVAGPSAPIGDGPSAGPPATIGDAPNAMTAIAPQVVPIAPIPSAVAVRPRAAFVAPPPPTEAIATAAVAPPPMAANPMPAMTASAPIVIDSDLDHEIALLSVARSALREGNPEGALTVLHDAALRFPNGPLAEDRAAETVFALCALGRANEARTAAARLLADHPRSPHATAVRESCGGPNGSRNP
jgi:hypothetical protein